MNQTVALIVAAGRGRRMPGDLPKQYRTLHGTPVLRHTLQAFSSHPEVSAVFTVIHEHDGEMFNLAACGLDLPPPVPGGETRQASVLLGLKHLVPIKPSRVLIHDGARPLVSHALISRVIAALEDHDGAIPALSVHDTLKRVTGGHVLETVPREHLVRAQTPQGFGYEAILRAHEMTTGQSLTDDAAVAEAAGLSVAVVAGDESNMKITREEDLVRAGDTLNRTTETRVGTGFDVHRFTAGDHVRVGGVDIPHDKALAGHSDADVALHALTDAILGALVDGDIGSHFPPSDPQWRGADSAQFLAHAVGLLHARHGRLVHADITVICERPKIGPHRDAMRASIAAILAVEMSRVSVKATTTEGLGFAGRREGIAAQAAATIEVPRT